MPIKTCLMLPKFLHAIILAATLAGCGTAARPSRDFASNIRGGLSAEDHLRVATFFESKAFAYDDEARQHNRLAHSYISNGAGDPAFGELSSILRDKMLEAAHVARKIAEKHRQSAQTSTMRPSSP